MTRSFIREYPRENKRLYNEAYRTRSAHKAAYPERFPISEDAKKMYPVLNGIEERCKATPVHLQLYDGEKRSVSISKLILTELVVFV